MRHKVLSHNIVILCHIVLAPLSFWLCHVSDQSCVLQDRAASDECSLRVETSKVISRFKSKCLSQVLLDMADETHLIMYEYYVSGPLKYIA
jgi:hypothetical protein